MRPASFFSFSASFAVVGAAFLRRANAPIEIVNHMFRGGTMRHSDMRRSRIGALDMWMALAGIASALLLIFAATQTQAQTFQVLHNFTGGLDGGFPEDGLAFDSAGNLYGTASAGGTSFNCGGGCGVAFKLSPTKSGASRHSEQMVRSSERLGSGSESWGRSLTARSTTTPA